MSSLNIILITTIKNRKSFQELIFDGLFHGIRTYAVCYQFFDIILAHTDGYEERTFIKLSNDDSHRSAKHALRTLRSQQCRYSCVDEKSMKSCHALTVSESPRERRSPALQRAVGSRIVIPRTFLIKSNSNLIAR